MGLRTAEEALADDQRVLGQKYGSAYYHCCQELWRVSANWDRYEALFGSSERVQILNSSSGHFWYCVQNMLFEHVLLGICRLTDPPRNRNRSNLSVAMLLELDPTPQKKALAHRIERARKYCYFARSWRDKRISHNDFDQLTGVADQLAPATRKKVSAAIVAIHDVLRWIQCRYFDSDRVLMELGDDDATQMLLALVRGRDLQMLEKEQAASGDREVFLKDMDRYPSSAYGKNKRYANGAKLRSPGRYRGSLPLQT